MRSKELSNKGSSDHFNINFNNSNKSNSQLPTLMEGSNCFCLFHLHHGKST